jgi:ADP-ribose pyrophosphatase YjhB (NUDIX family)
MVLADEVKFCPRCGSGVKREERFGKQRPVCPACGWVYFADPKVAVAVLVEQGGDVLLVRRVNEPFQGRWSLPAGFVDAGEDPARAAERECLEETGLRVRVAGLEGVMAGQEHSRGAHILIVYRAEIISGGLAPGDDADLAAFFSPHNLPPLAFESTRVLLTTLH